MASTPPFALFRRLASRLRKDPVAHWNAVYDKRDAAELSWFQDHPEVSLALIAEAGLERDARIIDVGAGASRLLDALLNLGYANLSVLDISEAAILAVQQRLRHRRDDIEWLTGDVTAFAFTGTYDLWHDRAVFHFLTKPEQQRDYVQNLDTALAPDGRAIIATFGPRGPRKCSGLTVARYDKSAMAQVMAGRFRVAETRREDHVTPQGAVQDFLYFVLERD